MSFGKVFPLTFAESRLLYNTKLFFTSVVEGSIEPSSVEINISVPGQEKRFSLLLCRRSGDCLYTVVVSCGRTPVGRSPGLRQ